MERIERRPGDLLLLVTQVALVGLGVAVLFSASYPHAQALFQDPYHFLKRQVLWILIGTAAALLAAQLPLAFVRRSVPGLVVLAFAFMVLTFVPGIGEPIQGARRWVFLFGLSFEPSELVKLTVVLYLASILSKKQDRMDDAINALLPPLLVVGVFVALTYLQNDFSTAFFILIVSLAMFLVGQVRLLHLLLLSGLAVPLGGVLLFTKSHRVRRLMAFLNPLADPRGSGYQVIASQTALSGGGVWGRGLGKGIKKLGGLPEAHSDFIFAVVGEETGFLGALFVLLLFVVFAWRGYAVAFRATDAFHRYLAFGLTTLIFLQAMLNIAVVAGLVPATGIPLPFFSSGGSSMLVSLTICGLLLNLSRVSLQSSRRFP
ncbi:MAG: putative lipid II flippase FtsW [Spirochaetales bacterium]|nr:putative lipid II flippase FtsW [Spirochaetales bacterium]